ncbi:hypothetical protein LTS18_004967 [Coniosporium uncinatum]|uniref:Uncharacterized protein n=1 Tax=Coniosporium uncinatum TaxID=93489 RepID=A0ACC3D581_9PEZI|nr:hypothetical protein LTS18_004967 [Coniosporium uncinatum]
MSTKTTGAGGTSHAWTEDKVTQLLMTIILNKGVTSSDWKEVAREMGPDYSASGVMQKFNKVRKAHEKRLKAGSTGTALAETSSAQGDDAKAGKRGGGKKGVATAKKGGQTGKRKELNDDGSDDSVAEEAPKKKTKKAKMVEADDDAEEQV